MIVYITHTLCIESYDFIHHTHNFPMILHITETLNHRLYDFIHHRHNYPVQQPIDTNAEPAFVCFVYA